jgi:hypothetical protein
MPFYAMLFELVIILRVFPQSPAGYHHNDFFYFVVESHWAFSLIYIEEIDMEKITFEVAAKLVSFLHDKNQQYALLTEKANFSLKNLAKKVKMEVAYMSGLKQPVYDLFWAHSDIAIARVFWGDRLNEPKIVMYTRAHPSVYYPPRHLINEMFNYIS